MSFVGYGGTRTNFPPLFQMTTGEKQARKVAPCRVCYFVTCYLLVFCIIRFRSTSTGMLSTPHRHQLFEEPLTFRFQRSSLYLLHLEFRPVQPLVMLIGEMTRFKDMSFECLVCHPLLIILCHHTRRYANIIILQINYLGQQYHQYCVF